MFIYAYESAEFASAGNPVTSGTPNTEVDHFTVKSPAQCSFALMDIYTGGRNPGLTTISSIAYRLKRFATASTGGAGPTPPFANALDIAAGATPIGKTADTGTAITAGVTPTYIGGWTSGATGPGGWTAPGAVPRMRIDGPGVGLGTASLDLMSSSPTASMLFEYTMRFVSD